MASRLALGTVQFGLTYGVANRSGRVGGEEAKAILTLAAANGVDILDTAMVYGDSETSLGKIGINGFKTITKLPAIPENVTDVSHWVNDCMRASLGRLGIRSVYGLLLRNTQQLTGPRGKSLVQALEDLKSNGVVQKIGVSIYSPLELDNVIRIWTIDLVQAPFNLIDQRLYTSGWLQKLHDAGIEVHTRSVFLQGLLLLPRRDIPAKFDNWSRLWDTWHSWLATHPVSSVHTCLSFVAGFSQIDRIVIGVDSEVHLNQIVDAERNLQSMNFPVLDCADEMLINPSNWNSL